MGAIIYIIRWKLTIFFCLPKHLVFQLKWKFPASSLDPVKSLSSFKGEGLHYWREKAGRRKKCGLSKYIIFSSEPFDMLIWDININQFLQVIRTKYSYVLSVSKNKRKQSAFLGKRLKEKSFQRVKFSIPPWKLVSDCLDKGISKSWKQDIKWYKVIKVNRLFGNWSSQVWLKWSGFSVGTGCNMG